MKNLLFAALSLVSNFSKYEEDNTTMKGMEIEKNSEFIISGTYENVNNFYGLNVTGTGTEDYFYSFELENEGKVVHNGQEVTVDDIKEGDTLKVTYDGSVSLVYPPKLNNVTKIEIVDEAPKNTENTEEKDSQSL